MTQKTRIFNKEYDIEELSVAVKEQLSSLAFANERIHEMTNHVALLQRAKNSYVYVLKQEMISKKAGFLLNEN